METSDTIAGSHATSSPCGRYVAFISTPRLRICSTHTPEKCTDINIRPVKDVLALKWSKDSSRVAVVSSQNIEVVTLDDASHHIRIDNGGAGLGRFSSADFVGLDQLLVVWEFGKAKLWNLDDGKGVEIADLKSLGGPSPWQIRPGGNSLAPPTLAVLSRVGSDDVVNIYFPTLHKQLASVKIPTIDAQTLSWSPDGRWLAVRDTPTASPSVHIFTPDGHFFRSTSISTEGTSSEHSLGARSAVWSADSQLLALTKHDGRIILLNTRTFTPVVVIEHTTTIDQRSLPLEQHAPIWQESLSAFGDRSYAWVTQPMSPPLSSRNKSTTDPGELGVAEARFSCDGAYLATRDERMLNTVWVWSIATLAAHAVLVQHANVRRLHWHPTQPDLLMLDCAEGVAYLFAAADASTPPRPVSTSLSGAPILSWLYTPASSNPTLMAASKSSFRLVYPNGRSDEDDTRESHGVATAGDIEAFDEGASEDSLFDVLSGRKPMHPKTEPSYTEMVDLEVETEEEDLTARVDDTFREQKSRHAASFNPLDDSEIF